MLHKKYLILVAALLALPMAAGAQYDPGDFVVTLLEDDFNDNSMDAAKWWSAPVGDANRWAKEQNQHIELSKAGRLATTPEYNPATTPLLIEGQWQIKQEYQIGMDIATRTDTVINIPIGGFAWTGLTFHFGRVNYPWNKSIEFYPSLARDGAGIPVTFTVVTKTMTAPSTPVGSLLGFQVMDDGTNISFRVWHLPGSPGSGEAYFTGVVTETFATNYVTFSNLSDAKSAPWVDYVDNVTIKTVPEPGSLLALGSGLIGLAGLVIRRRRGLA